MNRFHLLLVLLAASALIGCPPTGDDDDSAADDDDAGDDDDATAAADWQALILHGAFGGDATLASVSVDDLAVDDGLLGLSGSDWGVTIADGDPWMIGRFFIDTIRRYDGTDFSAPTLEFSTGAGTNPKGLAVCGDRIYVTRYDLTEDLTAGGDVAMFDLATGGPLGTVDLSAFNPHADGTPEPHTIVAVDGTAYVGLERLDRDAGWVADPAGKVVAIDCASGEVTDDWDVGPNPVVEKLAGSDLLQIRHDLGIDFFDPSDSTVAGAVADADLGEGYDSLGLAVSGDSALLVAEVNWSTNEVWCLDLVGGEATLLTSVPHRNWSVTTAPDGNVWVVWRDHWATPEDVEVGGIAIYDPVSCTEVTADWLTFASDPSALAFYDAAE